MGTVENAYEHENKRRAAEEEIKIIKGAAVKTEIGTILTPVNKEGMAACPLTHISRGIYRKIVAEIGPRCRLDGNEPRRPASVP